jgi:hypothetical protein
MVSHRLWRAEALDAVCGLGAISAGGRAGQIWAGGRAGRVLRAGSESSTSHGRQVRAARPRPGPASRERRRPSRRSCRSALRVRAAVAIRGLVGCGDLSLHLLPHGQARAGPALTTWAGKGWAGFDHPDAPSDSESLSHGTPSESGRRRAGPAHPRALHVPGRAGPQAGRGLLPSRPSRASRVPLAGASAAAQPALAVLISK